MDITKQSIEAVPAPTDGISSLAWSSKSFLAATSWDSEVRCWEVNASRGAVPVSSVVHQAPVLCSAWDPTGSYLLTGGCDTTVQAWDLETGALSQVGSHTAPVKCLEYSDELGGAVSASWDSTLKYWDLRSSSPVHDLMLSQRAFVMDSVFPLLAVGCAERQIVLYDMRKPTEVFRQFMSPLKYQTRSLAIFPDASGFALGSIEGRVAIHHVDDKDSAFNFVFKCHRHSNNIYAVNAISFHPQHGTFATAGSDGTFSFWDKDAKQRIKQSAVSENSISAAAFSGDGSLFAYAVSYDWHKGAEFHTPGKDRNLVKIAPVHDAWVQARSRT